MKRTGFFKILVSILCLSIVPCGCTSTGDSSSGSLYSKKDTSSGDTYFAQAPAMQTAEKELGECLFRIAGQISIRKKVSVKYIVTTQKKADGNIIKRVQVSLDYDQANSIGIIERLTVLKVVRTSSGTEALVKEDGSSGFKSMSVQADFHIDSSGNPGWVSSPPESARYFSAVGSISQSSNSADAFSNSDANAIGALAPFVVQPTVSGNTNIYNAVLKGVYIARRWYNQAEKRYYSLAILPR